MYHEKINYNEINITHDVSKRVSARRDDRKKIYDSDLFVSSKIEVRYNSEKGVH